MESLEEDNWVKKVMNIQVDLREQNGRPLIRYDVMDFRLTQE